MSSILLAPQPLLDLRQVVAHLAVEIEEPCRADVALPFGQVPLAEVDPPQRVPEGPQADDRGGVPRSDVIKTQVTKAGGRRVDRRAGVLPRGRELHALLAVRIADLVQRGGDRRKLDGTVELSPRFVRSVGRQVRLAE